MGSSVGKHRYARPRCARTAFGRRIIRQRRSAGLTQADLARRARIPIETLRRIEAGEATPDAVTMNRITNAIEEAQEEKDGS